MNKHPINPFNHDIAAPETPMVNVQVDGHWMQVPKGMNVVEVVKQAGKFLPHYCYHPKLSVVGNCRMCLFEMGTPKLDAERKPVIGADGKPDIAWMPRPQIGCATQVSEGMGIRTESPLAKECRQGVMEFLLINHPLDCPICDQAGECKLQEYSVEYGTGGSRFVEEKVHKPKNVDLGARIVLDDERCIMCSRCIRFSREVVQDDVLGFTQRGSYTTLTAHPGKRLDNDYSLNTADICPVGALTSKDFRFKMRVWFLKETDSICTTCGTGCNVTIGSREGRVYRLTPRENEEVNSHWMCDTGRLNIHELDDDQRITQPLVRTAGAHLPVTWAEANLQISRKLKAFTGPQMAMLVSARLTNEELFLAKLWAEELQAAHLDIVPRTWEGDKFLKSPDRNPNTTGARLLGVSKEGADIPKMAEAIRSGSVKVLITVQEDAVAAGIPADVLAKLDVLIAVSILPNATTAVAHYVLPGAGFAEKAGTMINVKGRLQRLQRAVFPPGQAHEDLDILRDLRAATSGGNGVHSAAEVFSLMAGRVPALQGLSHGKIGPQGVVLTGV
jgi:NADH-quinone oxidoreductase subunit G